MEENRCAKWSPWVGWAQGDTNPLNFPASISRSSGVEEISHRWISAPQSMDARPKFRPQRHRLRAYPTELPGELWPCSTSPSPCARTAQRPIGFLLSSTAGPAEGSLHSPCHRQVARTATKNQIKLALPCTDYKRLCVRMKGLNTLRFHQCKQSSSSVGPWNDRSMVFGDKVFPNDFVILAAT